MSINLINLLTKVTTSVLGTYLSRDFASDIDKNFALLNGTAPYLNTNSIKSLTSSIGDTDILRIRTNTSWNITNYPSWISMSSVSGTGDTDIIITTTQANSGINRTENIVITLTGVLTSFNVSVTQLTIVIVSYFRLVDINDTIINTPDIFLSYVGNDIGFVRIQTNVSWSFTFVPSWVVVSAASGFGDSVISITALPNSGVLRSSNIQFTAGNNYINGSLCTISQSSFVAKSLIVSNIPVFNSTLNNTQFFTITSDTNWTITNNNTWLVLNTLTGTGNSTITGTVQSNTGIERNGTISITGIGIDIPIVISVKQLTGIVSSLLVDYLKDFSSTAGDNDYFIVTSNVAWTIVSYPSWCSVSPLSGTGNANVTVIIQANTGLERTGIIVLSGIGVSNALINVKQLVGASPLATLSVGTLANIASTGGGGSVAITSNTTWVVGIIPSWLTVSPLISSNNGSILITAQSNTGIARSTTISITGTGVIGASNIVITQDAYVAIQVANYYVAVNGSNSNNGSITQPFATLSYAWNLAVAGNLIYIRGGTYELSTQMLLQNKNGTIGNLIKIWAYPGEVPIFKKLGIDARQKAIYCYNNNYIHFKGFEITGFSQTTAREFASAFWVENTNNSIFELFNYHHNGDPFVITHNSTGNVIKNCDAHHNYDPYTLTAYDDGDGFNFETDQGTTTSFIGCRSWSNSDDGFDFYRSNGVINLTDCWSWNNGYREDGITRGGNGTGYKLGITTVNQSTVILRTLKNCMAFKNRDGGFYETQAQGICKLWNNISWSNAGQPYESDGITRHYTTGIGFSDYPTIVHVLQNNISFDEMVAVFNGAANIHTNNTWNSGINVSVIDFISLDYSGVNGIRQLDGSLPITNFLKLNVTSPLLTKGIDLGFGYGTVVGPVYGIATVIPTIIQLTTPVNGVLDIISPTSLTSNVSLIDPNATFVKFEYKLTSSSTWIVSSATLPLSTIQVNLVGLTTDVGYDTRWSVIGNNTTYSTSGLSAIVSAIPAAETIYTYPFTALGSTIINKKLVADTTVSSLITFTDTVVDIENSYIEAQYVTPTGGVAILGLNGVTTRRVVKILNNIFQFNNPKGYLVRIGTEIPSSADNVFDDVEISGNKVTGIGDLITTGGTVHTFFVGFSINSTMKYNFISNSIYALLNKAQGMINTSGAIMYNVVRNTKYGTTCKGIAGTKIYNNTYYNNNSMGGIFIYVLKHDNGGPGSSNVKIKNNIFMIDAASTQDKFIGIYDNESKVGFECDYNVYFRAGASSAINFSVWDGTSNVTITWAQWQALGYDLHSIIVNPGLNTTTLVPALAVQNAVNLGVPYNVGLNPSNTWNRGNPVTKVQGSAWQNGAFII